jgi:regulator of sirC expression with transglutaminase-like and TPR domain
MTESEIKAMVSLLEDDDADVLNHVESQIYSFGEQIIPYLEDEWARQFSPNVQKRIENILQSLNYKLVRKRLLDWVQNDNTDLLKGMWVIATYQYPDLQLEDLRKKVEQLYFDAWVDFKTDLIPTDQVKLLNSIFFHKLKFKANTSNIKAVANSMINMILESKRSNPIGLCVLYMLVAQKLKLPIYGVNLPNVFVVTYKIDELQFYINVFNKGLTYIRQDIENYIMNLRVTSRDLFYEPCANIDIIRRVMRNLMVAYEDVGDTEKTEDIQRLLGEISEGEFL